MLCYGDLLGEWVGRRGLHPLILDGRDPISLELSTHNASDQGSGNFLIGIPSKWFVLKRECFQTHAIHGLLTH